MRDLLWDGARNVRDLGGLPTALSTTGVTSWGRVARGPRREMLTADGWSAATRWGLRSIVDLRVTEEVGRRHSDPDAAPPEGLKMTLTPTEDQTHPEFRAVCLPILDSPEYWQYNVRILPHLVKRALEVIAVSEPGVLVHCGAGRDRTGMVSALLLANAGVPGNEIIADYSVSVRAMAGTAAHGGHAHDRQASWSTEQVDEWLTQVTPHVQAFVADAELVLDDLQVELETRRALRDLLVT